MFDCFTDYLKNQINIGIQNQFEQLASRAVFVNLYFLIKWVNLNSVLRLKLIFGTK